MLDFPRRKLTLEDQTLARRLCGFRSPDLVIAPDGEPYLYRWYMTPHMEVCNIYFHIQVNSDPERPLHDHPWDNTSVILSGGYDEVFNQHPQRTTGYGSGENLRKLRKGDVQHREATEAHRLILPKGFGYTMTLFTTGPKIREWGFWFPDGWRSYKDVTQLRNGVSVHTGLVK